MNLEVEIGVIDGRLLSPISTEFPDPLTDEERISVNAYLVLCHACIEEFLEEIFAEHVSALLARVDQPLVPRAVAELLFAFGVLIPEKERPAYKTRTRAGVAALCASFYERTIIKRNNGLRGNNVRKLAQGAGVPWHDFELALLPALAKLDTLGVKRGEAGHLAPLTLKASHLSPSDYPDNVREWVRGGVDAVLAIRGYLRDRLERQLQCLITFDRRA